MSENNTIRIGIIGLGMGGGHARRLINNEIKNGELGAVCDLNPERLKAYEGIAQYTDVAEMLEKADIDAVIVATPHFAHVPLSKQCFDAGKHVLVEKPLAVHKKDCESAIEAADKHPELVFGEMFQLRTDPVYKKLKSLIDSGELGEIRRINWIITAWFRTYSYYASGDWRATWHGEGGGVLLNQCPHNLDLLQWLFGMPTKIRAHCHFGKYHDIEVEDDVTAYLEYPNGATGVFIASTGEAPGTDRLEITAENGRVVLENGKLEWIRNEIPMSQFCRETDQGFAKPPTWDVSIPIPNSNAGHGVVLQQFVNKINNEGELIADAREGINSVELGNAMLLSSQLDKTIGLPMDSEVFATELARLIDASPKTPHNQNA